MADKPVAAPDYSDTRTCDECGETFPRSDSLTVQWANVVFCSAKCRDRWATKQQGWQL